MTSSPDYNYTAKSEMFRELDISQINESNPLTKLVHNQRIVEVPELELESGITIRNFPIAYKTWGRLNENGDNCIVICHALTGSSDVSDWWNPLLGQDKAFDPSRFFIICLNSMGSPYGSFSPLTINEETGTPYGPEFPLCTVRDDVRAHKLVLDSLGINQIACVIGGSMGGMLALEWAAIYGTSYVKNLVALATSARHSAWCISWSEAQRQAIYSDPKYLDGYYPFDDPPASGLSAARMSALLTYRSRNSFESKFSRRTPSNDQQLKSGSARPKIQPSSVSEHSLTIHNDGIMNHTCNGSCKKNKDASSSSPSMSPRTSVTSISSSTSLSSTHAELKEVKPAQTYFSAQSYLRYQGAKFINRFDANCYIAITRKLDTHDLARDRTEYDEDITRVLSSMQQPSLIIGINSDGLFTFSEQELLADYIPNSSLKKIESPEGHDAFLLEFNLINDYIKDFLQTNLPEIVNSAPHQWSGTLGEEPVVNSVFGEAEDVTNW
ncbi:hypothetical protein Kpol_2000p78 [Vanderwaltozyma polyspora DSM 70294]|uniref:AB hydrolase-1 domain-containing protein n=1 Tax=Vanderwaltozyma polyspora (strain ATCC 22028 / DSM 70294 / BCRC 21397 / CBS 2163 / NBRC 10782 / NRRL Y-8283 / UCD 57-17) TaxID=436907 RepID=A7TF85_VANPO|nr:uncharacterized protein Kpol_2000p78 [Vanderwaltozyma polyspora DSM 70294]EDO19110.1 hypothetical protein Kpol_2000p78 [Vanderwaltozyma polyspora DSM 70294]